jgi:hypothetical protein
MPLDSNGISVSKYSVNMTFRRAIEHCEKRLINLL